jgi:hypothetical protein
MEYPVGISAGCWIAWLFAAWLRGQDTVQLTKKMVKETGIDGLELLPLRFYPPRAVFPEEIILSWSGRWASRGYRSDLRYFLQLKPGSIGVLKNILFDWVAFGGFKRTKKFEERIAAAYPNAVHSTHEPDFGPGAFEIHPTAFEGTYLDEGRVLRLADQGVGFTIDTFHLLKPSGWRGEPRVTTDAIGLVEELTLRGAIKLFHLHFVTFESAMSFAVGLETAEAQMLDAACAGNSGKGFPIILEYPPQWSTMEKEAKRLSRLLVGRVRDFTGG